MEPFLKSFIARMPQKGLIYLILCFRTAVMAVLWAFGLLVINFIIPCVIGTESTAETGNNLIDFWIVRLAYNLLGYATVFVPGAIIINYLRKIKYNETGGVYRFIKFKIFALLERT